MRSLLALSAAVFLMVVSATCCGPNREDPAPVITPVPGAELCDEACLHMGVVGPDGGPCEEATPVELPDGGSMSCGDFCRYQHENGVYWNTECLVDIADCAEIESVCNVPPP